MQLTRFLLDIQDQTVPQALEAFNSLSCMKNESLRTHTHIYT